MLRRQLPPEFFNRVDEMIVFHSLNHEDITRITELQFDRIAENLKKQGVILELDDSARDYLARHGYQPEFGARPIKRLIQREIVNELAKSIIEGTVAKNDRILITFTGGKLKFTSAEKK